MRNFWGLKNAYSIIRQSAGKCVTWDRVVVADALYNWHGVTGFLAGHDREWQWVAEASLFSDISRPTDQWTLPRFEPDSFLFVRKYAACIRTRTWSPGNLSYNQTTLEWLSMRPSLRHIFSHDHYFGSCNRKIIIKKWLMQWEKSRRKSFVKVKIDRVIVFPVKYRRKWRKVGAMRKFRHPMLICALRGMHKNVICKNKWERDRRLDRQSFALHGSHFRAVNEHLSPPRCLL